MVFSARAAMGWAYQDLFRPLSAYTAEVISSALPVMDGDRVVPMSIETTTAKIGMTVSMHMSSRSATLGLVIIDFSIRGDFCYFDEMSHSWRIHNPLPHHAWKSLAALRPTTTHIKQFE